jgi:cytochrome c oxidase accessory protein FixG
MKNERDLYKLTSIDEHGGHLHLIPAEVKGFFRKHRIRVQLFLLIIFLLLPWIHHQGRQLILLNIPSREFIFFGLLFKSHDAPLLFLLIAILTLGLALVTAIWGRIWCGWACPQTVFIDAVYRRIEIWTEGNYIERRRLQFAPLSWNKFRKKSLKWLFFFLVSALFAHSFAAYFTGSYELLKMISQPPSENWNYFLIISFSTALLLFNFGWFREQFCVIMCPYGRIQSVLLDPSSLAIVYDQQRGEPRRGAAPAGKTSGDCVSCNRCVEVCPTGIDIRNGLQMECISCTACIDACDEIMQKVKKPKGLIAYRTLDGSHFQIFKFKTVFYGALIAFAIGVLAYNLKTRESVNIDVLRGIDAPYSEDKNAQGQFQIINHFRLHMTSQSDQDMSYHVSLSSEALAQGMSLTLAQNPLQLKSESSQTWHLFVLFPKEQLPKNGKLSFSILIQSQSGELFKRDLTFLGPTR